MKYTIKQAKCLKLDLKRIEREEAIKMNKDLIAKLDIEAMYPSITYELVAEAVRHYAKWFSEEDKMRVEGGLEMLKFSMSNCLINFGEEYFQWPATYWREQNQYGKTNLPTLKFIAAMNARWPGTHQ